jgi:hypothetical protein
MGNGQADEENWKKIIIFVVNTSQDTPNRQQYNY